MDVLTSHSQCASNSPSQIFTPSQPNISARKKPARRGGNCGNISVLQQRGLRAARDRQGQKEMPLSLFSGIQTTKVTRSETTR